MVLNDHRRPVKDGQENAESNASAGIEGAYGQCLRLATTHYENFPVLSWTMPRIIRPHVAAVYAFARNADDDADEIQGEAGRRRLDEKAQRIRSGQWAGDPDYRALGDTIRKFNLPLDPFLDLISAFRQDTEKKRYDTFAEVLDYCRRSANPVGRVMLMLYGFRDDRRFILSDRICTALQLINFWQDIRADYIDRDRIYAPRESLDRFGVREEDLRMVGTAAVPDSVSRLVAFEIDRADRLMREGVGLMGLLPIGFRWPTLLFAAGGWTILSQWL